MVVEPALPDGHHLGGRPGSFEAVDARSLASWGWTPTVAHTPSRVRATAMAAAEPSTSQPTFTIASTPPSAASTTSSAARAGSFAGRWQWLSIHIFPQPLAHPSDRETGPTYAARGDGVTTSGDARLRHLPKVLLHDHFDGGLRPHDDHRAGREPGYRALPTDDPDDLASLVPPRRRASQPRAVPRDLPSTPWRCSARPKLWSGSPLECGEDLAADGVVYAESRFAAEVIEADSGHVDGRR